MKTYDIGVFYTDGSARPNKGNTGWGIHGYLFNNKENTKKTIVSKVNLVTITGYSQDLNIDSKNYAEPIDYLTAYGTGSKYNSNNSAEIDALLSLLQYVNSNIVLKKIYVYTDSNYLKSGILEWKDIWESNGYSKTDGDKISNIDKWTDLFAQIDIIKSKSIEFNIDWVKGHGDNYGNITADRLATLAVLYQTENIEKKEFDISSHKEYNKIDIDRHPFIDFSRLYFNSQEKYNLIGQYFLADPGKDELVIGKKIPETTYCVINITDNGDPVIEAIKRKQFKVSKDLNSIMMVRLDRAFQSEIYPFIKKHGDIVLFQANKDTIALNFLDNKPITVEINPAGLSLKAMQGLSNISDIMEKYLYIKNNNPPFVRGDLEIEDITDKFYEEETDEKIRKKKPLKLKASIDNQLVKILVDKKIVKLDYGYIQKTVPIVLGVDILRRNGLKKIEDLNPKISLLTWIESNNSIRYATVIEINGAIGIWSNYYANRLFF